MFKPNRLVFKQAQPNINVRDLDSDTAIRQEAENRKQKNEVEQVIKSDIDVKVDAKREELKALSTRGVDSNLRWMDQESALKGIAELDRATSDLVKLQILQKLDARRHRFNLWQQQLPLGNNVILDDGSRISTVYTLDPTRGYNSAAHATERFITLPDQLQETWLKTQLAKINENKALFNKLVGMVSKEFKSEELRLFQTKTRSERQEYLNLYQQHSQLIERGKYHPKIQERLKAVFAEQGIHGKKLEVARLREAISVNTLDKSFEDTPSKYRNISEEEFYSLDNRGKRAEIEKIKDKLRNEYMDLYKNQEIYSDKDHKDFNQFAYSDFDIQDMLNSINIYFKESEAIARSAFEDAKKYSPELLKSHNWKNLDLRQRRKLLDSGDLEKNENTKWNEKYEAKLKKYMPGGEHGKFGLINKKSAKEYLEWYKKQSIKDKKKFYKEDDIDKTEKQRTKNNKEFEALETKYPQYFKEYKKQYMLADSEGRADIIAEIKSKHETLTKDFGDKVAKMIKAKTLSKKSGPEYLKWFADLNIKDKEKHLKASDLDDKNREKILQSFKEDIVPNLPKSKKKQIEKKFYEADLDKRTELLAEYLKIYGDGKTIEDVIPPEAAKSPENLTLDFLKRKAEQFASEGKASTAIDLYQDWLAKVEEYPELAKKEEVSEVKKEIKRLQEENIELKENGEVPPQLLHFIEHECEALINSDEALKREVKNLTVIQEIGDIMERTELRYGQKTGVAEQMQSTIQNEDIQDLDDLIQDQTNGEHAILQEHGQYRVEKTQIFDMNEFKNDESYRENWTENMAEEIIQKPEEQRTNRAIGAKIDGKEVKAEEFKRREVQPIEQNIDQQIIERILAGFAAKGYNIEEFRPIVEKTIANKSHKVDIKPKRTKKAA
jgi:hypothetical protein